MGDKCHLGPLNHNTTRVSFYARFTGVGFLARVETFGGLGAQEFTPILNRSNFKVRILFIHC